MSGPTGVDYDSTNTRLFVADSANSRVTIYNVATGTIANGENASNELGQPSGTAFTSSTAATSQSGMSNPLGVTYDSTNNKLYVDDGTDNRITLYNTSSVTNGENASDLLGEYNSITSTSTVVYTQNGPNNGPTALGFNNPVGVALDAVNHNLYVSDWGNNRVLVYTLNHDNSIPTASGGHTASYVLGQTALEGSNGFSSTQSGLKGPRSLAVDGVNQRLFVADQQHNRVLVFSTSSILNGMNASYVLGQPNFTTVSTGLTQAKMDATRGLAYDAANSRLFEADYLNQRVLVWNVATGTIANGENASYVLGQSNFTTNGSAVSQSGMGDPYGLAYDPTNTRLFVVDSTNNRVLVYNVAPSTIANGENASYVLGQSNFTSSGTADTQSGMHIPYGVSYDPNTNRLFVSETGNERVLVFNVSPTTIANGMNAAYVVGQSAFTTNTLATTQSGFWLPGDVLYDNNTTYLFVTDQNNNRVMILDGTYLPYWPPGYE